MARNYILLSRLPDWRWIHYEEFWQTCTGSDYNVAGMSQTRTTLNGDQNRVTLVAQAGDAVHIVSRIAVVPARRLLPVSNKDTWRVGRVTFEVRSFKDV